jgi:hypothetical protein
VSIQSHWAQRDDGARPIIRPIRVWRKDLSHKLHKSYRMIDGSLHKKEARRGRRDRDVLGVSLSHRSIQVSPESIFVDPSRGVGLDDGRLPGCDGPHYV